MRVACAVSALALIAGAAQAQAVRTVPLEKMFPYLSAYHSMAPAERDSFRIDYRVRKPDAAVTAVMVNGARRVPLQINGAGWVLNAPDAAMLRGGLFETTATREQKFSVGLTVRPVLTLAAAMPAAESAESVREITAGIRRFAGVLGFAAPRITGVAYEGVRSGEAVMADGRRVALPVVDGDPVFRPAAPAMRGAVRLEFPSAPTGVDFAD